MAINDRQEPGSITKTADAQNERISGISNVSRTVTQMQKTTQRKIEETQESINYGESQEATSQQMNSVLSRFGKTITAFTKGVESISISTARATKDAIGQYGKAISQDLNYNKQNIVAMALARSTPLFGYFAAKFMETDVFQKAKERMKESIAGVFKGIGSGIANIFKGGKNAKEAAKDKVPKMQRGGYVEKGGMIEVHPAEVVMPIEKILARIDDSISVGREIAEISQKTQMRSLAKMSTFVSAERDKEPVGLVKGFLRAMREVQTQYEEPASMRMLRAVLSIQDTLGATIGTWEQVWTKMLIEHPTFRQLAFGMKTVSAILGSPFQLISKIFKRRGGYLSQLSKKKNPFENIGENLGSLYVNTMHRLDNISFYTKATAVMIRDIAGVVSQGRLKYGSLEAISEGTRSLFGWARFGFQNLIKYGPRVVAAGIEMLLGTGKGALYARGKKIGDYLTQTVEWGEKAKFALKSKRQKKLDFALGGAGDFAQTIQEQHKKRLPPLITISAGKAQEKAAAEVEQTREGIEEIAKVQKKKWLWEKMQAAKGGIKSVFSWIFRMLMMGGGLIKSLFGFGAGGVMSALFSKTGPIGMGVAKLMAGPVMTGIKVIGAYLATTAFLGPILALITTALTAVGVGSLINKYLVKPLVDANFKKQDEVNKKGMKDNAAIMKKQMSDARGTTATGKDTYDAKISTAASATVKGQGTWFGTSLSHGAIRAAQNKFIVENRAKYSEYDEEEIIKARNRWRRSGKYWLEWKWTTASGANASQFGEEKEAAFLKYLQNVGTKNKDLAGSIKAHEKQIMQSRSIGGKAEYFGRKHAPKATSWIIDKGKYAIDKAGQLIEKVTGRVIQGKELAEMQAQELLTSGKLVGQEIKKRGLEQVEGLKGLGDQLQQNINQVRNDINQQVSNVTRIFNSGNQGSMMDEMAQRVATGNFH
jgi:hypothetical protein